MSTSSLTTAFTGPGRVRDSEARLGLELENQCGIEPAQTVGGGEQLLQALVRFPTGRPTTVSLPMSDRSAHELVEFSSHLLTDVQVFFRAGRMLTRRQLGLSPPLPWEVETALIESFALHTRAFADFFYRDTGRDDDAFATHYFPPNAWQTIRPAAPRWVQSIRGRGRDRVGKEIVHLTYHRLTLADDARGWPVVQVAGAVGTVLRVFIEEVDDRLVAPEFKQSVWAEIPVFARVGPRQGTTAPVWPDAATLQAYARAA